MVDIITQPRFHAQINQKKSKNDGKQIQATYGSMKQKWLRSSPHSSTPSRLKTAHICGDK